MRSIHRLKKIVRPMIRKTLVALPNNHVQYSTYSSELLTQEWS